LVYTKALDVTYYKVIKHRNSIKTWSAVGTAMIRGGVFTNYNFIQPDGQAYGNNQAVVSTSPFYRGMYSGDVDQDGFVDGFDLLRIDNDAAAFLAGYVQTDLTGDNFVDGTDFAIADNNAALFVSVVDPPGAEPMYVPNVEELQKQLALEKDAAVREKIQTSIALAKEESAKNKTGKVSYEDFHKLNNPGFVQKKAADYEVNRNVQTPSVDRTQPIDKMLGEP
jgi:hypothetical protein